MEFDQHRVAMVTKHDVFKTYLIIIVNRKMIQIHIKITYFLKNNRDFFFNLVSHVLW